MVTEYENYRAFVVDLLITIMDEGSASVICNYQDYSGLIASLNEHTINGKALALTTECADMFDDDILTAQMNSGNMMITVFDDGGIIGEPILFETAKAFVDGTYFVEIDADGAMNLPLSGEIIPFCIKRGIEL